MSLIFIYNTFFLHLMPHSKKAKDAILAWKAWYESTAGLCFAGKTVTQLTDYLYSHDEIFNRENILEFLDSGDFLYLDSFVPAELETRLREEFNAGTFREAFDIRDRYWLSQSPGRLEKRLRREGNVQQERFLEYLEVGDSMDAFGVMLWAYSSLSLLEKAKGKIDHEKYILFADETKKSLEQLIELGKQFFREGKPEKQVDASGKTPGIYYKGVFESDYDFVKKYAKFNFLNVFEVADKRNKNEKPLITTVTENWDFEESEINICIPLSIGCKEACGPCQIGQVRPAFYLTADQSYQLLYKNALINQETTELPFSPTSIKLYLLGGGDPGSNIGEFENLVSMVHEFYDPNESEMAAWVLENRKKAGIEDNDFYQIIASTIGIRLSVDRLIMLGKKYAEFGLQFSVGAFNQEIRNKIITAKNAIGIDDCVKAASRFYDETGKRGYLAIHPLEANESSVESYMDGRQISEELRLIKERTGIIDLEEKIVITLTAIESPPVNFGYHKPSKNAFRKIKSSLEKQGYTVTIYDPPYDPRTGESCGVIPKQVLEKFIK